MRSTLASAGAWRTSWAASCTRLGRRFRSSASRICHKLPRTATRIFRSKKRVERGRTKTTVTRLDEGGRVEELGRMLGGAGVTEGIRASAREMLMERRIAHGWAKDESKAKDESESPRRETGEVPRKGFRL